MNVISHRGFWRTTVEKNTLPAFECSVRHGFGTETDARDAVGRIVIAHDPATGSEPALTDITGLFEGTGLQLAINVKADGLAPLLALEFSEIDVDWFAFDMSGPEMVKYRRAGLPYYTRHSDLEPEPILYETARGVWLDGFESTWFDETVIQRHLDHNKRVCVVSSELHGRDPDALWSMLDGMPRHPNLTLCTDRPDLARKVFTHD